MTVGSWSGNWCRHQLMLVRKGPLLVELLDSLVCQDLVHGTLPVLSTCYTVGVGEPTIAATVMCSH